MATAPTAAQAKSDAEALAADAEAKAKAEAAAVEAQAKADAEAAAAQAEADAKAAAADAEAKGKGVIAEVEEVVERDWVAVRKFSHRHLTQLLTFKAGEPVPHNVAVVAAAQGAPVRPTE